MVFFSDQDGKQGIYNCWPKQLTSAASNTVSIVEVVDTEDSTEDDQEPNDISVDFLLESQHRQSW